MKYTILVEDNQHSLIATVNEHLEVGWKCQGGVCHTPETKEDYPTWSQAMIKEE